METEKQSKIIDKIINAFVLCARIAVFVFLQCSKCEKKKKNETVLYANEINAVFF